MPLIRGHSLPIVTAIFLLTCGFIGIFKRLDVVKSYQRLSSDAVVDCNPDIPCVYPETVDLRVIIMTYNRPMSLLKLLQSLDAVETDGDSARMEIWIDRNRKGSFDNVTLIVAQSFKWSKGPVRVHVQKKHVGIYGQWIDTWAPRDLSTTEMALIFEDDISVSPYCYRWLKAAHRHYSSRPDVMCSSLLSDEQKALDGSSRILSAPKNHTAFLYKSPSTWGVAPYPRQWARFQNWFHNEARPNKTFHPYVKGIIPTSWYKSFEASGTAGSMWSMWIIYFMDREKLYTVFNNLPRYVGDGKSCLSINRREVGLHVSHKGREDLCKLLTVWKDEYIKFPEEPATLDWNGYHKAGY